MSANTGTPTTTFLSPPGPPPKWFVYRTEGCPTGVRMGAVRVERIERFESNGTADRSFVTIWISDEDDRCTTSFGVFWGTAAACEQFITDAVRMIANPAQIRFPGEVPA